MARGAGQYVYTGKSRLRRKYKFKKLFGSPGGSRRSKPHQCPPGGDQSPVTYTKLPVNDTGPLENGVVQPLNACSLQKLATLEGGPDVLNGTGDLICDSHIDDLYSHSCRFCDFPSVDIEDDYFSSGSSDSEELVPLVEVIELRPQFGKKMPLFGKKKKAEPEPKPEPVVETKPADEEGTVPAEEAPAEEAPAEAPAEDAPATEEKSGEPADAVENGDTPGGKKAVEDQPGGMLCCTIM